MTARARLVGLDVARALALLGMVATHLLLEIGPDGEQFWPGQSRELYDALTCPKALVAFTAAEGADGHCEPLAPTLRNQRVFDWLDETLGRA